MAPRPNWKGYLRLSLVSCPIALYPASTLSEKVSFNRINRKTGNRLKQQNIDSETGDVVPREDTARGFEARRVSISSSKIKKSMPCKSKAPAQSKSINSFREARSMTVISTRPTTSRLMAKSDRMLSRSFAIPSPK